MEADTNESISDLTDSADSGASAGEVKAKAGSTAKAVDTDTGFSKIAPPPPPSGGPRAHHVVREEEAKAEPKLSFEEVVQQVMDGDWGEGKDRAHRLRSEGYAYLRVEAEVQRRLRSEA